MSQHSHKLLHFLGNTSFLLHQVEHSCWQPMMTLQTHMPLQMDMNFSTQRADRNSSQTHAIFSHTDGELLHSAFTLLTRSYFCFSPPSPSKPW